MKLATSTLITVATPGVVPAPSIIKTSVVAGVALVEPVLSAAVFQLEAKPQVEPDAPTQ